MCEDKRSEVPGIFNKLTESILGWDEMIAKLHERGVHKISLVYADRLRGLEAVGSGAFPGTQLQRCTTPRIDSDRELYPWLKVEKKSDQYVIAYSAIFIL